MNIRNNERSNVLSFMTNKKMGYHDSLDTHLSFVKISQGIHIILLQHVIQRKI